VPHDAKVKEWGTGRTRLEAMQALMLNPMLAPLAGKMDGIQAARTTLGRCGVFIRDARKLASPRWKQYRREWDDERRPSRPPRSMIGRAILPTPFGIWR